MQSIHKLASQRLELLVQGEREVQEVCVCVFVGMCISACAV
jgi:hypothetical protein